MQLLAIAALLSAGSRFTPGTFLGWTLVGIAVVFLIASGLSAVHSTRTESRYGD